MEEAADFLALGAGRINAIEEATGGAAGILFPVPGEQTLQCIDFLRDTPRDDRTIPELLRKATEPFFRFATANQACCDAERFGMVDNELNARCTSSS
jgi:hypothetical protein